jgi:hypothetical protein
VSSPIIHPPPPSISIITYLDKNPASPHTLYANVSAIMRSTVLSPQ